LEKINNFLLVEPDWLGVEQFGVASIPVTIKDWLLEQGSLTLRMKNTFTGPFSVSVEGEGWSFPYKQDAEVLQIQTGEAFIREVVLNIGQIPYVFARTTIPRRSLDALQQLATLGARPLGEVIFSYPELKRMCIDVVQISRKDLSLKGQSLLGAHDALWARRNTYDINGHQFIVSEFFLPSMFNNKC